MGNLKALVRCSLIIVIAFSTGMSSTLFRAAGQRIEEATPW
jgi:hypothetical protein